MRRYPNLRTRTGTKRRRRSFRRRRNYRRRASAPYKIVRVLKSVKYLALNPGAAGAIDVRVMAPNAANDPSGAEGTEQPLGFDEAAAQYNKYCVIRCWSKIEATSADATNPICVGANMQNNYTALTSYVHYKELPNTQTRLMTPEQDKVVFGIGCNVGAIFGSRVKLTDDRFVADVTAAPSNLVSLHVFAQPVDQTTDVGVVHCVVTTYQTVVFFKPKTLARS